MNVTEIVMLRKFYRRLGFGGDRLSQSDALRVLEIFRTVDVAWVNSPGGVFNGLRQAAVNRCRENAGALPMCVSPVRRLIAGGVLAKLRGEFGRGYLSRVGVLDGFELNLSRLVRSLPWDVVLSYSWKSPAEVEAELVEGLRKSLVDAGPDHVKLRGDFNWALWGPLLGFDYRDDVVHIIQWEDGELSYCKLVGRAYDEVARLLGLRSVEPVFGEPFDFLGGLRT